MCLSTTAIDVDSWKLTLYVCTQWVLREEKENCWTTMVRVLREEKNKPCMVEWQWWYWKETLLQGKDIDKLRQ